MSHADYAFIPDHKGLDGDAPMPPRSLLYALEPIGVGTSESEGLISYVIRLANEYAVNPHRLISEAFCIAKPELAELKRKGTFFVSNARSVNGLHQYSAAFVEVVEALCQVDSAKFLTLLPLKGLFPANGQLLALSPRWCPACYADMMIAHRRLYQPLAWSFDMYGVCTKHGTAMVDRCPTCGKAQHVFPRSPMIGFCCHCSAWLGKRTETEERPDQPFQRWVAEAIETIVAALPRLERLATRHRFVRQLDRATQQYTRGSRRRFCQEIGIHPDTFQGILGGGQRPTFSTWLTIAYGLKTDPVGFLEAHYARWTPHDPLRTIPAPLEHRNAPMAITPTTIEAIADKLAQVAETGNPPVSVLKLASELGVTRSLLKHRWPDLCHKISNNYRAALSEQAQKRISEKRRLVLDTMERLIASGICPTHSLVQSELADQKVTFADAAMRDAFRRGMMGR